MLKNLTKKFICVGLMLLVVVLVLMIGSVIVGNWIYNHPGEAWELAKKIASVMVTIAGICEFFKILIPGKWNNHQGANE